MKKLLFFFILLMLPFSVGAKADLYADVKIEKNGDLYVTQALILDGEYNGFELRLMNTYHDEFAIFSAKKTEIVNVCEASIIGFNTVYNIGDCFKKVNSADKGDRLKYTLNKSGDTYAIKMFNPSNYGRKAFVIQYRLKDVVVRHDDIAELRLNIVNYDFEEYIGSLEYRFTFADEVEDLRIWGHGPFYGEVEILSNKQAVFKIENLRSENIDARITFDLDIVSESTKKSGKDNMLQTIIDEETKLADEANYCRDLANTDVDRYQKECLHYSDDYYDNYYKESSPMLTANELKMNFVMGIAWLIGLIIIVVTIYRKYDQEHRPINKHMYFREFPNDYSPDTVQYLLDYKIDSKALSACILNIIRKKGFTIQQTEPPKGLFKKNKEDYILTKEEETTETLTDSEIEIQKLLMDNFSFDKKTLRTSTINDIITRESAARRFLKAYEAWINSSMEYANKEELLEKQGTFWLPIIYAFIPVVATFMGYFPQIILLPASIGLVFYILSIKRYTEKGLVLFEKWNGLKRFLKDVGNFKEKELPEIHLWEKYLVFATLFGYAEKIKSILRVKMAEMKLSETDTTFMNNMFISSRISNSVTKSVDQGISSARSTIAKAEAARSGNSSWSSGGGGGGGFSGGGGGGGFSGGGGSGGGRF